MAGNNQKIKLLRIMEYLRSETSIDKPATTNQIIEYLSNIQISCDRRTLYKDMNLLIESGANIIKTELGRENAYYIDEISLSLAELKLLVDAVQAANFITHSKTEELTQKLLALSGVRRSEIIRDHAVVYNNHKRSNEDVFESIEQIALAIKKKKQISFYYFDLDEKKNRVYRKKKKRYITDPVALVFSEDNYYLVAYSQKYQNSTNYRVDRMDTVEIEDASICEEAIIRKRSTAGFAEQVFKMYSGDAKEVTLEFQPDLLGPVYDKFGENIMIRHTDGGKLLVRVMIQVSPTFWGWIYQFGDRMKVVSPEDLKPEFDIKEFYK